MITYYIYLKSFLKEKIASTGQKCYYSKSFDDAIKYMEGKGEEGDVFLVVGAGNITTSLGWGPYPTISPKHKINSTHSFSNKS